MIKDLKVNEIEEGIVNVSALIDKDAVKNLYEKNSLKVQQKANIKGFRKGKAPLNLVRKIYESEIKYETINSIFPSIYDVITKEHSIVPMTTPEISGYDDFSLEKDLELQCKVESAPYVKSLSSTDNINIEGIKYEYDEANLIEKEIETLAEIHSVYNDIEGTIQKGDFIQLRYKMDSPEITKDEVTHYVLLKEKDPQFDFTSHLIEKNLGETYTESITFPEKYQDVSIAGKTLEVTYTPIDGRRVVLPPIDDELAKKFHFDTIANLRSEIVNVLKKRSESKSLFDTYDLVLEEIIKTSEFSISEKVILTQTQHQLQKKLQKMMQDGSFHEFQGKDMNDQAFMNDVKQESKVEIQKFLVQQDLIKNMHIEATDIELEQFIKQISEQEIPNRQEIIDFYKQNTQKREELKQQLIIQKLAEELTKKINISSYTTKTM